MPNVPWQLILAAGAGHALVLAAAAMVPFKLDWRRALAPLPRLHRQMYVIYGAYVVLSIIAFGLISVLFARDLAAGGGLARAICAYIAVFWAIRLALQWVLDVRPYLTAGYERLGYHALTVLFAYFTIIYTWSALGPAG